MPRYVSYPSSIVLCLNPIQAHDIDVWHVGTSSVDLFIPRGTPPSFDSLFADLGLTYVDSPLSDTLIYPQRSPEQTAGWDLSSLSNSTFHTAYRTSEEIGTFVKDLLDLYPNQVRLVPIGHSAENREMFALEITSDNASTRKKSGFVITGAQHAREASDAHSGLFHV